MKLTRKRKEIHKMPLSINQAHFLQICLYSMGNSYDDYIYCQKKNGCLRLHHCDLYNYKVNTDLKDIIFLKRKAWKSMYFIKVMNMISGTKYFQYFLLLLLYLYNKCITFFFFLFIFYYFLLFFVLLSSLCSITVVILHNCNNTF